MLYSYDDIGLDEIIFINIFSINKHEKLRFHHAVYVLIGTDIN